MGPYDLAPEQVAGADAETDVGHDAGWYRLLLDHAADILLVLDASLRTTWVSPSVHRILGWEPADIVGDTRWDLIHPVDLAAATGELARLATGETDVASIRLRLRHRHGSFRWWRATGRRVVLAATGPVTEAPVPGGSSDIVIAFNDIDEAIHAAERERAERARFHAALDAMLDPFLQLSAVRDASGAVVDFVQVESNQAACDFFGRSREQVVGRPIRAALSRVPHVVGLIDRLVRVVETGTPLVLDEAEAPDPAGQHTRWYDIRAVKADDGLSLTFRDVTQRAGATRELAESEQRYRILTESMRDVVWVLDAETQRFGYVSPSVELLRGFTADDVMAAPLDAAFADQAAADGARAFLAEHLARLRAGDEPFDVFLLQEVEQPCKDGSTVWTEIIGKFHLNDRTGHVEVWAVSRDVGERRAAAAALAASEERYRLLTEHSPDVVALVSAEGRLEWISPSCERALGWAPEDLVGRPNVELVHPDDLQWFEPTMAGLVADGGRAAYTIRLRHRDGGYRWMEAASEDVPPTDARPRLRVVRLRDVDAQVNALTQLEYLATHDSLTELVNRRELVHQVEALLARKARTGSKFGVLFLDVDGLKAVNDRFGHATGDRVLQTVAARISATVRHDDLVARFGGDEFVVVLPAVHGIDDVLAIAAKIHAATTEPIRVPGEVLTVSVSVGAALAEPDDGPDAVLGRADAALYRAKRVGGGGTSADA